MADTHTAVQVTKEAFDILQQASREQGKTVQALASESIQAHLGGTHKALKAFYKPQTHLREKAVVPSEAAVLFIDVQNYNCSPDGEEAKALGNVRALCPRGQHHLRDKHSLTARAVLSTGSLCMASARWQAPCPDPHPSRDAGPGAGLLVAPHGRDHAQVDAAARHVPGCGRGGHVHGHPEPDVRRARPVPGLQDLRLPRAAGLL
jgi:hypothetical protein